MSVGDDGAAASTEQPALTELAPGTVLGGYQIEAVAGRGGMGIVYRARQLSLGRTVALKVIDPLLATDPGFRERFERESAVAASLDHPNVVTIYEAGEDHGRLYTSMRFVPGTDLGELLTSGGPLDPVRAAGLLAGVADALDAAHAARLVHRDVKPSNVLVERRAGAEHAFLSDFGVVKRIGADAQRTGSAGWVGTADFVAPEQVLGGAVDARTDVYALGGVLYTALTGRVPFERADIAAKLYASVNEPVPSVREWRPELPAAVDGVIARATAKDPDARYATAGEFAAAARAALTSATPPFAALPAAEDSAPPRAAAATGRPRGRWRSRGATLMVAGLVLVALIAVIVIATTSGGGGHRQQQPGAAPHTHARAGTTTAPPTIRGSSGTAVHAIATVDDFAAASGGTPSYPDHLRVSIYDLRRSGPFVVLDFGVRCVQSPSPDGCALAFDLAAGTHSSYGYGGYAEAGFGTASGVTLVDPLAKEQYLPVTDSHGQPDSSDMRGSEAVGSTVLEWVKFAAPPSSVHALDVLLPESGPVVTGVPISSGPAPSPSQVGLGVQAATPADFAYPESSADTNGLRLPVENLNTIVGSRSGSDSEAGGRSTITLNADVLFRFDKSNLTPAAQGILQNVAARIKSGATGTVTVVGYTDSIGTDAVNIPLSQTRANSVVAALKPAVGAAPVSFQASGMGSADPVAPNTRPDGSDNPTGRALNRRVTISYAVKAPTQPAAPPVQPQSSAAQTTSGTRPVTLNANDGVNGNSTYTITADRLFRDGALAVLELTATCQQAPQGCAGLQDFSGTPTAPPIPAEITGFLGGSEGDSASGIYAEDPTTGTEYNPVYNTSQVALTSDVDPSIPIGTTQLLWIYLPAPAASVSSLKIVLPAGASISGIPLVPTPASG